MVLKLLILFSVEWVKIKLWGGLRFFCSNVVEIFLIVGNIGLENLLWYSIYLCWIIEICLDGEIDKLKFSVLVCNILLLFKKII